MVCIVVCFCIYVFLGNKDGDVIYFWTYVIRDGLGYEQDDGVFNVTGAYAKKIIIYRVLIIFLRSRWQVIGIRLTMQG